MSDAASPHDAAPLTLGTAGHIDHGKTALVRALTGIDTDRLPEEQGRGMSIELGYAPLDLGSGRAVSVVDVPGHARFVRTMVAGATGIDAFLMVVAADDGVMPQTREHASVLASLGVADGVIAITKSDLADPARAGAEAAELLPSHEVVTVSAREGRGLEQLRGALARMLGALEGRGAAPGGARLHIDRRFSIRGAGTVVTGTLWSGSISRGDALRILPQGTQVRVRGVQVHDQPVTTARAGQRVAVNLVGTRLSDVDRGDMLVGASAALEPTFRVDAALQFTEPALAPEHGDRVQVHHGTREAPARLSRLGGRFWQVRLEAPLLALAGDRVVVRRIAPPYTLGGGVVLDAQPPRHGPTRDVIARLTRIDRGESPEPLEPPKPLQQPTLPQPLSEKAMRLEALLRDAWFEPPLQSSLTAEQRSELPRLRAAGRAVRTGPALHYHPDALAEIELRIRAIVEREGSVTLARLRDELSTSRKFAQALLEHFDAARVTRRLPTDERVLRGR